MDIYREEILEHYRHPINFGMLRRPSHFASVVNPLCGDRITLQLQVDPKGIVRDVAFEGSGCALSIASASLFTEWMKGKKIKQILKKGESEIEKLLGTPIGPARLPCINLAYSALEKAFLPACR